MPTRTQRARDSVQSVVPWASRGAGETWAGIVASVRAPLGFYVVCLLIVESMLTFTLTSGFDQAAKFSGVLLGALLFIIVVFLFTHLVIFHAQSLTFRPEDYIRLAEINKLSASENLRRVQIKTGAPDSSAGGVDRFEPAEEPLVKSYVRITPGQRGVGQKMNEQAYLNLERRALAQLSGVLRGDWRSQDGAKITLDRAALIVDGLLLSANGEEAVVVETRLDGGSGQTRTFTAALAQLDRAAKLHEDATARRTSQLLLLLVPEGDQERAAALLAPWEPIFASSSTSVAVYVAPTNWLGFAFNRPHYVEDHAPVLVLI